MLSLELPDHHSYGLGSYTYTYEHDFAQNKAAVLARYNSRNIALARGLEDHGDASSSELLIVLMNLKI